MKLNTTPRIADFAGVTRELREHASEVNALAEGRLTGTYNAQTAAPTTGTHAKGDFIRNSTPTNSGGSVVFGWECIAGGTPGTFVECRFATNILFAYRAITTARTLDDTDELVDCTSGTFTVTLPTAVGFVRSYTVKNSGSGVITVGTTSAQTIDGNASVSLNQYESVTLRSNNANWVIV